MFDVFEKLMIPAVIGLTMFSTEDDDGVSTAEEGVTSELALTSSSRGAS